MLRLSCLHDAQHLSEEMTALLFDAVQLTVLLEYSLHASLTPSVCWTKAHVPQACQVGFAQQ